VVGVAAFVRPPDRYVRFFCFHALIMPFATERANAEFLA